MAIVNYSFPDPVIGAAALSGVQVRSGVRSSATGYMPDMVVVSDGQSFSGEWSLGSGATAVSEVTLAVFVDNPGTASVTGVILDWGDGDVSAYEDGYFVQNPDPRLFAHDYAITDAVPDVVVRYSDGTASPSSSLALSGLPVSADWDVDQVQVLRSVDRMYLRPEIDWRDVADVPSVVTGFVQANHEWFSSVGRRLNSAGFPETTLNSGSLVPLSGGSAIQFDRVVSQYDFADGVLSPYIRVVSVDSDGVWYPDNPETTLSVFSGPGTLVGTTVTRMYDGYASYQVGVSATGFYILSASALGYLDGYSDIITVS